MPRAAISTGAAVFFEQTKIQKASEQVNALQQGGNHNSGAGSDAVG
jgi:hypothetical protein